MARPTGAIALLDCCRKSPGGVLVSEHLLVIVCTEHLIESITDDLARSAT